MGVQCFIDGTYSGDFNKYSDNDLSLIATFATSITKPKEQVMIDNTEYFAFVTNEIKIGFMSFIDFSGAKFFAFDSSGVNQAGIDYIPGTRTVVYNPKPNDALEFFAFDEINPNSCATFADSYSLDCGCSPAEFTYQGSCLTSCPSGTYEDNVAMTCEDCVSPCQNCTGPASTECSSCPNGRFLDGTSCLISCPAGKYGNTVTNTCDSCDPECSSCTGPANTECSSCSGLRFLEGSQCVLSCSSGSFKNTVTNTCDGCHSDC